MIKVLIVLVAIIFIAQIVRIFEISSIVSKTKNEVTDKSNHVNGILLLLAGIGLVIFFFWQRAAWMDQTLSISASEHGPAIDGLWDTTMGLIIVVFLILTPVLFGFSFFYRGKKDNKASYITHNNKLEFFWTAIPAIVLLVLISYGLNVWGKIVNQDISNAMIIEVYAKQFSWTARYAGEDNKLGAANVRFVDIGTRNELGVISKTTKEKQVNSIEDKIKKLESDLEATENPAEKKLISKKIEKLINKKKTFMTYFITTSENKLKVAEDDVVTKELHLPVGKQVLLKFRSQDVIHSAYLPHFRVQMNCVPGTTTQFGFTPTITTEEMRKDPKIIQQMKEINSLRKNNLAQSTYGLEYEKLDHVQQKKIDDNYDEEIFDYTLLCNKICGAAHWNMQMKVVVETEEEYNEWLESQKVNQIANL